MKWQIDETFKDILQPNETGYVKLNPDIEKYLNNLNEPVTWTGIINGLEIEIRLIGDIYNNPKSYEFIIYPQILDELKNKITKFISDYYNYLN